MKRARNLLNAIGQSSELKVRASLIAWMRENRDAFAALLSGRGGDGCGLARLLAAAGLTDPDGTRVALTSAEFDLLSTFCDHPGRVLSRERLLDLTQGPGSASQDRSVDIVVSRLRLKIEKNPREPDLVQTVRSSGYIFSPAVETVP